MKVKIFAEAHPDKLEAIVNKWLEENPWVKVKEVTQSNGNTAAYISIWYEEPNVPILG